MSIDIVGPLTVTLKRNTCILVLLDNFKRWRNALPMLNTTANTIAELLQKKFFCYLGLQEQIHTDQEKQLESKLMAKLCAL